MPLKPPPILVTTYGCVLCQKWHVKGIDTEYDAHLHRQGKHQGPRERPATPAEIFRLEMERPMNCPPQ